MNDILELEIEKRILQEEVTQQEKTNEEARQKALRIEQEKQDFVNTIRTNFVRLTESTPVTINREEKFASFVYKKETYFILKIVRHDDTNIPDEGYLPHDYEVWVLRKGSVHKNNQYSGFVSERSNEYTISQDWSLSKADCYEEVIKGLRSLNEPYRR